MSTLLDQYIAGTGRRYAYRAGERPMVDHPGVVGFLGASDGLNGRILVVDDRAMPFLRATDLSTTDIWVLGAAAQATEFVSALPNRSSESATAMVCPDPGAVPKVPLPAELTLRPVRRLDDDDPDGVLLEAATSACLAADPVEGLTPEGLAHFLRIQLPPAARLLAAVDRDGVVRATSGAGVFGRDAAVIFVSTDVGWRRRGIGLAMTAAAIRAAVDAGARDICLDASAAGKSIYLQLGFLEAGPVTLHLLLG